MPTHLPPDEILAEYASGAATPGVALLIASHLTQAPESRRRVEALEAIGGAVLSHEEPAEMSSGALDAVMAMLDATPEKVSAADAGAPRGGPLPAPVLDEIGLGFDEIPWKFQLPGVSAYDLEGFAGERVRLLRAKPGSTVPQHTHEGTEMTLVFQGCLSDGGVDFRQGDVAVNDEDDDHCPRITGDDICYCLIVQQGDLRFTGRFSRVLNYLGE